MTPGAERARALVLGVAGQDGVYLAAALRRRGYSVFGMVQTDPDPALATWLSQTQLVIGDLQDADSVTAALATADPDVVINLAALSSVAASWADPESSAAVNAFGVLTVLERIRRRQDDVGRQIRFIQASSAEIFGNPTEVPQCETTPIAPRNPYGAAKAFAHEMTGMYRSALGVHASSLVLFNHESPLRPESFVTRKITKAAARIATTGGSPLVLGNLEASRDWGFAGDYVEAMALALECETPGDYVVASGSQHTVRDFAVRALSRAGIEDWQRWVQTDESFMRPTDAAVLLGDSTKAKLDLGWLTKVSFEELVDGMVDVDLDLARGLPMSNALLPTLE